MRMRCLAIEIRFWVYTKNSVKYWRRLVTLSSCTLDEAKFISLKVSRKTRYPWWSSTTNTNSKNSSLLINSTSIMYLKASSNFANKSILFQQPYWKRLNFVINFLSPFCEIVYVAGIPLAVKGPIVIFKVSYSRYCNH